MSESIAITTVVTSLKELRDDYQQQLKNVPQYSTYLELGQLAAKASEALGIPTGTDGLSPAHEVLSALAQAQTKFADHLATVPEYRALLAINKLIGELGADLETPAEHPTEQPVETLPATGTDGFGVTGVLDNHDSYAGAVSDELADVPPIADQAVAEAVTTEAIAELPAVDPTTAQQSAEAEPAFTTTPESPVGFQFGAAAETGAGRAA